jgi:hypothetical protein
MLQRLSRSGLVMLGVVMISTPAVVQAQAPDITTLLAEPLSPGQIALLVTSATRSDVQDVIRRALTDRNVAIRATAARVVAMTAMRTMADPLNAALRDETSWAAATEQVRALLMIGVEPDDDGIRAALTKHGRPVAEVLLEFLARHQPADFAKALPSVRGAQMDSSAIAEDVLLAFDEQAVPAEEIGEAFVPALTLDEWKSVFFQLRSHVDPIPAPTWQRLLEATNPDLRHSAQQEVAKAALYGVASARSLLGMSSSGNLTEPVPDPKTHAFRFVPWDKFPKAYLRTVDTPSPEVMSSLFAETRCKVRDTRVPFAAEVSFHSDGRPKSLHLVEPSHPGGCATLMTTLAALTPASRRQVSRLPGVVLAFVDADSRACDANPRAQPAVYQFEPGLISPPKATKTVRPQLTQAALAAGSWEGTVSVEIMLSEQGCPRSLEAGLTDHHDRDVAAIFAARGWRFSPAVLDGKPRAVRVMIPFEFTVRPVR